MNITDNILKTKNHLDESLKKLEDNVTKDNIKHVKSYADKLIEYFVAFSQDLYSSLHETEEKLKAKSENCIDRHELDRCKDKVEKLLINIADKDNIISDAEEKQKDYDKIERELRKKNDELNKKIEKITEDCDKKSDELAISVNCKALEEKIRDIQRELEETKNELRNKPDCDSCDSHISRVNMLEEKNKEILNELISLGENIKGLEQINTGLVQKNKLIESEKLELIRKLRDISDEIEEQRLLIMKYTNKIDEQKSESLQSELEKVGKNLECQQLRDEVQKYIEKNKKLEINLQSLGDRLKDSVGKSERIIKDTQKLF